MQKSGFTSRAIRSISSVAAISRLRTPAHRLAQHPHVAVLDVAAILAQVHGDAVGAGQLAQRRRGDRIRVARAALLAQRRHVVDVDVEADHQRLSSRCSVLAISSACARIPASSVPSIITRAFDSVPE